MAQDSSDNNNFSNFDNFDDNLAQPSTSTGKASLFYIDRNQPHRSTIPQHYFLFIQVTGAKAHQDCLE